MRINLISDKNFIKLLKRDYFNIIVGGNFNLNKKILETKNVNLLLNPEPLENDFMNYKNSGLNQVLVKLAKGNNIGIGFSLNRLIKLNKLDKSKLLGKIMQNIRLCNKYKVKYYIVYSEEKNISDLKSLALILGIKNINLIWEKRNGIL